MRLKKIVLNGFKSFADKTEFPIDVPITAIVGPNGCGKSNVVDAVKWVLGEQRVKSLRSDQMVDVIFSGSSSRKPMGAAEVSLVFSNPTRGDTRQLAIESDEVQISRKVFRSGDSEYRINGKRCRLKDIREIFMDTGIGARAYSIIEQGQIDKLISVSKTERRGVFEEAAGISKYKAHKTEALRKLERTEQNLLRVADILEEVAKRLRSVKLQAGKARNYLQYTQRLKELQVNYSLVEYARQDEQLLQTRQTLESHNEQFARLTAELTKSDAVLSELNNSLTEKEHALSESSNHLVSVQSRIEQTLQHIDYLRVRSDELTQRRASQRHAIDHLREQIDGFESDLARYDQEADRAEALHREKSDAVARVQESLRQLDGELTLLETDLEDEKSGIIDIVRRTAQLHNEVQSISDYRSNLSSQKQRLATRAESARAELASVLTEKAQHKTRLDDIEKVLRELDQNLTEKRQQIEALDKGLAEQRSDLAECKERRSALNSELSVLADMERRNEGVTKAVKQLLQDKDRDPDALGYIDGLVAHTFQADVSTATAVEAALGDLAEAVVVTDMTAWLAQKDRIEALTGRVQFISLHQDEPEPVAHDVLTQPGVQGCLADLVTSEEHYQPLMKRLLGRTLLVSSLDVAYGILGGELYAQGLEGYQFVTDQGQCLTADGVVRLGPLGRVSGLVSRKSHMHRLQTSLEEMTAKITAMDMQIQRDDQSRAHLDKLCKDLRTSIYEATTEQMQINSKLTVFDQNVKRLTAEQPLIAGEMESLEHQIATSVQKEYESKQKLDELEAVNSQRSTHIDELESRIGRLREQREEALSSLTDLKIELGQVVEQSKAAKQMMTGLHHQIETAQRGSKTANQEILSCTQQIKQAERDILADEARVSELFVDKEQAQDHTRKLKEAIQQIKYQQVEAEEAVRTQRDQKNRIEQDIGDVRVTLGQLEVKQQDLVERVRDELQIDLAEAYENYTQQNMDWDQVREEINDLRSKIERLGNVNVDAIEEQESLEERHAFLSQQAGDLETSKTQLEQLIAKLNKTSRERFAQTFEEIRAHFQQIFRKLFGGGKADIVLDEAEDILDAGIEVMAKPPGKETRSISLLSGGEKSMTALALQFAVFRTKPSPFCFLDEVDAALDEANNERFNLLLKDFNEDTQFIVVTHAKRTMSIADVLFGVTMQTQGVSKKISVRFDEYDTEAAVA